jgi:hypothetical protein
MFHDHTIINLQALTASSLRTVNLHLPLWNARFCTLMLELPISDRLQALTQPGQAYSA